MTTPRQGVVGGPEVRLATYGTLAPARPNHHQLIDLSGLDRFEGPGYRRVAVDVTTAEGVLPASIYVLARPA